ncbi:MAG: adenylate/guanylate cyclase domain-containing protein [Myxococcota bacterium]
MASFVDVHRAVRAAIEMHHAFDGLREHNPDARRTSLKVGAHGGPCYAITANGVLDCFGQSVNVAARLQGQAGAGEVVTEAHLADEAAAQGWVSTDRIHDRFTARLKGVPEPVAAARIRVDDRAR